MADHACFIAQRLSLYSSAGNHTVAECAGLVYAGVNGQSRYAFDPKRMNFQPRVGFAYKLGTKTVVRSGYGIFYNYMEPLGDAEPDVARRAVGRRSHAGGGAVAGVGHLDEVGTVGGSGDGDERFLVGGG